MYFQWVSIGHVDSLASIEIGSLLGNFSSEKSFDSGVQRKVETAFTLLNMFNGISLSRCFMKFSVCSINQKLDYTPRIGWKPLRLLIFSLPFCCGKREFNDLTRAKCTRA